MPARRYGTAHPFDENGAVPLVRVNAEPDVVSVDLEAACLLGVAVVLPKVKSSASVKAAADRLNQLETERGIIVGSIRLIAQDVENVAVLPWLDDIASSTPRLLGMALGSEDFAASAGMEPFPEALLAPNQSVVFACRRASVLPFGFPACQLQTTAIWRDSAAISVWRGDWALSAVSAFTQLRSR